MLILEPVSNNKIWGTTRLHKYGGDKNIDTVGSVYTASAINEIQTKIVFDSDEQFAGLTFYEAVNSNPELFGLESDTKEYPLIISITGADEDLSIQVHPTDDFAEEYENRLTGKSESWYFIEAPESGSIYAESKLKDKESIKKLITLGEVDNVVDRLDVRQGDLVYIPSGTLHALTKGALVYEIQQSTDLTYRFFDYNRVDSKGNKRELHLEKAIETLNTDSKVDKNIFNLGDSSEVREYRLDYKNIGGKKYVNTEDIAQVITIIEGSVFIDKNELNLGTSVVVMPGEQVQFKDGICNAIIATPIKY